MTASVHCIFQFWLDVEQTASFEVSKWTKRESFTRMKVKPYAITEMQRASNELLSQADKLDSSKFLVIACIPFTSSLFVHFSFSFSNHVRKERTRKDHRSKFCCQCAALDCPSHTRDRPLNRQIEERREKESGNLVSLLCVPRKL